MESWKTTKEKLVIDYKRKSKEVCLQTTECVVYCVYCNGVCIYCRREKRSHLRSAHLHLVALMLSWLQVLLFKQIATRVTDSTTRRSHTGEEVGGVLVREGGQIVVLDNIMLRGMTTHGSLIPQLSSCVHTSLPFLFIVISNIQSCQSVLPCCHTRYQSKLRNC